MKTKLFKMKGIYTPVFYRKVTLAKQKFWEYCETIYHESNFGKHGTINRKYLWKRCEDPFVMRYGVIEGEKMSPSNPLEFLLLKGCTPDSIRRIKRKKVER